MLFEVFYRRCILTPIDNNYDINTINNDISHNNDSNHELYPLCYVMLNNILKLIFSDTMVMLKNQVWNVLRIKFMQIYLATRHNEQVHS